MQGNAEVYGEDWAEGRMKMFNLSSVLTGVVLVICSFLHDCSKNLIVQDRLFEFFC